MKNLMLFTLLVVTPFVAHASLGGISENLIFGADLVVRLMWAACIIVGISLIVTGLVHFQTHRNNPKLVPMSTPLLYLFLGILAISIPYAERILGFADGYLKEDQRKSEYVAPATRKR